MPVVVMLGAEPATPGGVDESDPADIGCLEGGERDDMGRVSNGRKDEPVEVVEHGAGNDLRQGADRALVCAAERLQIAHAFALLDDRGRIPEADQDEIGEESSSATVAVEEGGTCSKPACAIATASMRTAHDALLPAAGEAAAASGLLTAGPVADHLAGWGTPQAHRPDQHQH
ncbi:hypothetical protein GCM10027059_30610 [Myceligenerans halotolerans]